MHILSTKKNPSENLARSTIKYKL